jgi:hypothetical protein
LGGHFDLMAHEPKPKTRNKKPETRNQERETSLPGLKIEACLLKKHEEL